MARKSSPSTKRAKPTAKAKPAGKATTNAPATTRSTGKRQETLADLKRQVFGLAKVSSTKQLKQTNLDLRHLDFRLKASWRSALEVLQQAVAAMAEWDRNPPEDYKELFAEIDQAVAAYSASIEKGFELSAQLSQAADDMEALSGELRQEAEEMKAIQQASRKQRRARSLN